MPCTVLNTVSARLMNSLSAGADGLRERVDPGLLHRGDAAQRAQDHPVGERGAPVGEVAVGEVAVVPGRHEEILPAGALVGARDAHVRDVAEPEVVDDAQRLRRRLDHRRTPRLEVKKSRAVGGFGVRGEEEALRVGSGLGDADDPGRGDARGPQAAPHRHQGGSRHRVEEHLDAAHQIQRVIHRGHRVRVGTPSKKSSRPNGESTVSGDDSCAMASRI